MLRRSRTREPTCTSTGFGLADFWRPGRRPDREATMCSRMKDARMMAHVWVGGQRRSTTFDRLLHADASALAPYGYLRLALATYAAAAIFGEWPDFGWIAGSCVIIVA